MTQSDPLAPRPAMGRPAQADEGDDGLAEEISILRARVSQARSQQHEAQWKALAAQLDDIETLFELFRTERDASYKAELAAMIKQLDQQLSEPRGSTNA